MFPEDMQMLREDAEDAVVDQAIDNGEVDLDNIPEDEPNDIDSLAGITAGDVEDVNIEDELPAEEDYPEYDDEEYKTDGDDYGDYDDEDELDVSDMEDAVAIVNNTMVRDTEDLFESEARVFNAGIMHEASKYIR